VKTRAPATYYPGANGKWNNFHSILKGCLQTIGLEGKSWKPFTADILPNHRSDMQQAACILQGCCAEGARKTSEVLMFSKAPYEQKLLHSYGWVDSSQ